MVNKGKFNKKMTKNTNYRKMISRNFSYKNIIIMNPFIIYAPIFMTKSRVGLRWNAPNLYGQYKCSSNLFLLVCFFLRPDFMVYKRGKRCD